MLRLRWNYLVHLPCLLRLLRLPSLLRLWGAVLLLLHPHPPPHFLQVRLEKSSHLQLSRHLRLKTGEAAEWGLQKRLESIPSILQK